MSDSKKPLRIDIPVKLTEVKIAFNFANLSFEGDLPACFFHMGLIMDDIADWKAKAQVIAVFNTNAGHPALTDVAYNRERMIKSGNPYKDLVTDLMKRGVQMEMCGATATAHKWTNSDFIPGVRVNTDAMARLTQLAQEGFVIIDEWV